MRRGLIILDECSTSMASGSEPTGKFSVTGRFSCKTLLLTNANSRRSSLSSGVSISSRARRRERRVSLSSAVWEDIRSLLRTLTVASRPARSSEARRFLSHSRRRRSRTSSLSEARRFLSLSLHLVLPNFVPSCRVIAYGS